MTNAVAVMAASASATGCIIATAGVYEFFTANKLETMTNTHMPKAVLSFVHLLDTKTITEKCSVGLGLVLVGQYILTGLNKPKKNNPL